MVKRQCMTPCALDFQYCYILTFTWHTERTRFANRELYSQVHSKCVEVPDCGCLWIGLTVQLPMLLNSVLQSAADMLKVWFKNFYRYWGKFDKISGSKI